MKQTLAITRKELAGYFGSPMALIFVGVFLAVTLFTFFWVDTFFAKGLAEVRSLFRWMPALLILLVSALTMRQWSEEQRSGTLEVLLTLPVSPLQLVLGKFLAVMALVGLSLALTLILPITVAFMGPLDAGPVIGGYLAALLLAAAYTAIGLFISSRTDNQIVALILTVLVCGLLYLVGTPVMTELVGQKAGDLFRAFGSGSRFESIERGVIDLRDLLYYLTLTGVFGALTVLSLDSKRWSKGPATQAHRRGMALTNGLLIANLLFANLWAYPLRGLRLDLTSQHEYSLSPVTRELLANLQEPLVIRGYFSEKTHPLLAPLVPGLRDMLEEYKVAGGGKVQVEIIDPVKDPQAEAEANQSYGIHSTPFQVQGRYESSIINSYFDILIRYGDQNVVLGYQDLIEIDSNSTGGVDVRLANLEYKLTSSIKKVVYGFQSATAVLAALDQPAKLTLYVTPDKLPDWLQQAPTTVQTVAQELSDKSGGKLTFTQVNPEDPTSGVSPQSLYDQYGLQAFAVSPFSNDSYYFGMVLQVGDQSQVVYPSGDMAEGDVRTAIESALKHSSSGFLKVVGIWTPPNTPTQNPYGQAQQPINGWNQLQDALRQEYEVRTIDLSNGQVPADVDVLLVVAPQGMNDKERYAIDQYLMRGGSVIAAAGNYGLTIDPYSGGPALQPLDQGLREMLQSYGIYVAPKLVMDPQNEPFPVYVTREVNGMQVQQIAAKDYPYFIDVRSNQMSTSSAIVANLPAVTMNWTSPITISEAQNTGRHVVELMRSSASSWVTQQTNLEPDYQTYPDLGFAMDGTQHSQLLALTVQGSFTSAFKDKPSPFETDSSQPFGQGNSGQGAPVNPPPLVQASPDTARLVVFGSAEFVDDPVFQLSANLSGERYLNSLKLVQNAVAWAVEDQDLLGIRSRGNYTRVLNSMTEKQQSFWEGFNYAAALLMLVGIGLVWNVRRRREQPIELLPVKQTREVEK